MKKLIIKTLAALTAFGAVMAMAASLGGVSPDALGAEDATVAACDTNGIATSFSSAWDATDERYETSTVTIEGVSDSCDGQTIKVTVTDSTGQSLSEGTLAIPTNATVDHVVTLASGVATEDATSVHVNIS
jgi:hypothetical protein